MKTAAVMAYIKEHWLGSAILALLILAIGFYTIRNFAALQGAITIQPGQLTPGEPLLEDIPQVECGNGVCQWPDENTFDCEADCPLGNMARCGDTVVYPTDVEECDDGNFINGDGCNAICELEEVEEVTEPDTGIEFQPIQSELFEPVLPVCGDGILDSGEQCDPAQFNDGEITTGVGYAPGPTGGFPLYNTCRSSCTWAKCGDGIKDSGMGESCDDGNLTDGDGCSSFCVVEVARCGDGVVDPGEKCDSNDRDVCTDDCRYEFCGNGIKAPSEECDDSNNDDGDGCSSICEIEEKEPLDMEEELISYCGDGSLNMGEECDDGNNFDGDGCSSICELEVAPVEPAEEVEEDVCDDQSYGLSHPLECGICSDLDYQDAYPDLYRENCPGAAMPEPEAEVVAEPAPPAPPAPTPTPEEPIVITRVMPDGEEIVLKGAAIPDTGPRENIIIAFGLAILLGGFLSRRKQLQ